MPRDYDKNFQFGGSRETGQDGTKPTESREMVQERDRNSHDDESELETIVDGSKRELGFTPQLKEIANIKQRLDTIENNVTGKLPIAPLTPSSDLEAVKRTLNKIINYVNTGVRGG